MSDTYRSTPPAAPRQVDEIRVHERKPSAAPLVGLAVLGLVVFALWGYSGSRGTAAVCNGATVHFAEESVAVDTDADASLRELASCLRANPRQAVRIEGHADPSEVAIDPSLARSRAIALARWLAILGVPATQFAVDDASAACTDDTAVCRSASVVLFQRATP